ARELCPQTGDLLRRRARVHERDEQREELQNDRERPPAEMRRERALAVADPHPDDERHHARGERDRRERRRYPSHAAAEQTPERLSATARARGRRTRRSPARPAGTR